MWNGILDKAFQKKGKKCQNFTKNTKNFKILENFWEKGNKQNQKPVFFLKKWNVEWNAKFLKMVEWECGMEYKMSRGMWNRMEHKKSGTCTTMHLRHIEQ